MNERPSSTAFAEKPDVGEEVDDVGDRLGREHDRVVARRRASPGFAERCARSAASAPSALGGELGGVACRGSDAQPLPPSGAHREHGRLRAGERHAPTSTPSEFATAIECSARAHLAGGGQPARRATARRSRATARGARLGVEGAGRRRRRGRRSRRAAAPGRPGNAGSSGATRAAATAASQHGAQRVVVEPVGARDAHALAEHRAHADDARSPRRRSG